MKGQRTLFDQLIVEPEEEAVAPDRRHARAVLMVARYYHKIQHQRLRYDVTISELAGEFFLSERTVTNILMQDAHTQLIKQHMAEHTTARQLRQSYPHLVWD